jgi:sugar phosphate isomerase/epimerase
MSKPKIGLSMLYCLGEPFSKMLKRLDKVETCYVEVLDDGLHALTKKRVTALNQAAKSRSIQFTVHAPFADINIASPSKPMLTATLKRLKESMAYASALNAKLWVFHPGSKTGISMFYPGEDWKQNVKGIRELHKTAEEYGLNIAMENLPEKYGFIMKTPEDFQKFYKETGINDVGIVLDVGHANLEGQTENFLRKLPDKIGHIHVSDNMGENDQHLGLGYGKINWQRFAETLREIDYDKMVMIESAEHVTESLQKLRQLLS